MDVGGQAGVRVRGCATPRRTAARPLQMTNSGYLATPRPHPCRRACTLPAMAISPSPFGGSCDCMCCMAKYQRSNGRRSSHSALPSRQAAPLTPTRSGPLHHPARCLQACPVVPHPHCLLSLAVHCHCRSSAHNTGTSIRRRRGGQRGGGESAPYLTLDRSNAPIAQQ